jgi:hypothetical protein
MMGMEYDQERVDEMILALLYLTTSRDQYAARAWKGFDLAALERLHRKGYLSDPEVKSPTVLLTEEGARLSRELFARHFGKQA